ncbi:MAG: chemotaxis protein CheA [Thermacetogeniaceae bacterium]
MIRIAPFDAEFRQEMIAEFINESRDLLDEVEPQIIELEQTVNENGIIDAGIINSIFRLFHTIKGSASFLNLKSIIEVTHGAETLLDLFRTEKKKLEPSHVDLFCRALDFIRNVLDQVERDSHDQGFEQAAKIIVNDLADAVVFTNDKDSVSDEEQEVQYSEDIQINSVALERFVDEGLDLCEKAEAKVLALEQSSGIGSADQILHDFGSLKDAAATMGFAGIERVSCLAEQVLREAVIKNQSCNGVVVTVLLTMVDTIRAGIRRVHNGQLPEVPDVQQVIHFAENALGLQIDHLDLAQATKTSPDSSIQSVSAPTAQPSCPYSSSNREKENSEYKARLHNGSQFVRVDTRKLDQLIDLVGELVIAEAMVAGQSYDPDDKMGKAIKQMDKITKELQDVALSLRMVPLTATFRKMMRLVRDLAHQKNKQVELVVRGQETEVDKTVIEQISDPLIHLIRNAIDHGIEDPDKRRKVGKPETGRILIEAGHRTGKVWIIVKDDGRGLNREKIVQKGVEQGIITEDESRNMTDEQVWQLIFTPGFSTADIVSDISGRGVGMDVVKANVEKMNGRVDIESSPGRGTAFVIKLPLTLAIIEGMIVRVGQNRYTIPISSIEESFRPTSSMITAVPGQFEVVQLREELLPVVRLHELYHIEKSCDNLTEGILVAVQHNEQKYCLFVDELLGQQQIVIKGLPAYLKNARGISGCAILSDGGVSLILDTTALLDISRVENTWNIREKIRITGK